LYERFELLALHRDDGVKTFHAREIATRRPVHVHLFADPHAPQNMALLARLERLPEHERRRIIDRGEDDGTPYVVTDRLVDQPGFREWLNAKAQPLDIRKSFDQAGAWRVPRQPEISAEPVRTSVDEEFAELFGPVSPEPEPEPPPAGAVPVAAKSLLGLIIGIAAALLFLALIIAVFAFRPRTG